MTDLQAGITAQIVIQTIGRAGIDVALVKSLESDEDSTDRLMLGALESDLAVIDWRPVEVTAAAVRTLSENIQRAPHALDPDVPPVPAGCRKLYAIDLRSGVPVDDVIRSLEGLLSLRRVSTVSLGLGANRPAITSSNDNSKLVDTSKPAVTTPLMHPRDTDTNSNVGVLAHSAAIQETRQNVEFDDDDGRLDTLVDQLNLFDP